MSAETATEQELQRTQRLGRFLISHAPITHDWRCLLPLFAKVVILRAESLYHLEAIEYLALCEDFEEVEMGAAPPAYRFTCVGDAEGGEVWGFERLYEVDEAEEMAQGDAGDLQES